MKGFPDFKNMSYIDVTLQNTDYVRLWGRWVQCQGHCNKNMKRIPVTPNERLFIFEHFWYKFIT